MQAQGKECLSTNTGHPHQVVRCCEIFGYSLYGSEDALDELRAITINWDRSLLLLASIWFDIYTYAWFN